MTTLYSTPIYHKLALSSLTFAKPEIEIPFTGYYRLEKQSRFFFKDLGAKELEPNTGLRGFSLSSDLVKARSGKVFGKWRALLREPKNTKLLEMCEANLSASNLAELFSFPREVRFLNHAKNKTVLIFLDYTIPSTMQIREILNFSLRGYDVLVVDLHRYCDGKTILSWNDYKAIADKGFSQLSGDILVYGKSYGAAAAIYLGTKHEKCPVIIDRGFISMEKATESCFSQNLIKKYYSYPNHRMIKKLKSQPLIIYSSEDNTFKDHSKILAREYISSQLNKESTILEDKCLIYTKGGHYSSLLNKGKSSWFSYQDAQKRLNLYLSPRGRN